MCGVGAGKFDVDIICILFRALARERTHTIVPTTPKKIALPTTAPTIVPVEVEVVAALVLFMLLVVLKLEPINSDPEGHPSAADADVPLATVSKTPPPTQNPVTESTAYGAHEHDGVLQTEVTPPIAYQDGA